MISPNLTQAEELLRSNNHQAAQAVLASIERPTDLPRREYGYYCILLAEVYLRTGNYRFDTLDQAIEIFRFHKDSEKFARAKYLRGWQQAALGQHREAEETLLESYAAYRRCRDALGAARVLNRISYVLLQLGSIDSAIANIRKSAELYSAAGRVDDATVTEYNLAILLALAGHLREALAKYEAVGKKVSTLTTKNRAVYYGARGLALALRGSWDAGHRDLDAAEQLSDDYPRDRAIVYEDRGWVLLLEGKHDQAERSLSKGLKLALEIAPESTLVSQIKRLLADTSIAAKHYPKAKRHADEALAVAEKVGQKVEVAACYRVFAQVELNRGDTAKAQEWFRKASEIFSLISSRYELAVTRYLAGSSGVFEHAESAALLYLAKEYFEAEEVAPYIDKVRQALIRLQSSRPVPHPVADKPVQIVAGSKVMLKTLELARQFAPSSMTVLLTGETGTGKDLLASYLHECSGRTGRFISQNFGALPVTLAEAELFGYHKGAFTGADHDRPGLFEEADGGTFFFNEIGEAPMEIQAKLLEVLSTRTIRRLGDTKDRPVNVRVIAATNQDLQQAIRENRFRVDLYHRLNEISMHLPPLSERAGDVPLLVAHFLGELGLSLTDNGNQPEVARLASILEAQAWPGNVRELRAEIARLHLMANGDLSRIVELAAESTTLTEEERLERLLEQTGWNQSRAAQILGISEAAIRKRMRKFGLVRG